MMGSEESAVRREDGPVLVVGAGPVGLAATAELLRRGVPVRCVDAAAGPCPHTRSLAAWPRLVEILRGLGVDLPGSGLGQPLGAMRYHSGGRLVFTMRPPRRHRPLVIGQPAIEAMLREAVSRLGGTVEWSTRLTAVEQDDRGVRARLQGPDGRAEWVEPSHVLGADGASSTVRKLLGIPFEGSTYPVGFVLADARHTGAPTRDADYHLSAEGMIALVGMPGGYLRVFTSAPPGLDPASVTLDDVQRLLDARGPGGITLSDPVWLAGFSVHARQAARMRDRRVFLMGDAAHVHSPAGGQGLNTGVGDAHNLAWKLAMVRHGRARPELLDTYEPERKAAVAAVVRDTDLQTRAWLVRDPRGRAARDALARVVSATRLADLAFTPRLAGQRARYPADSAGPGPFRPGTLAPDRRVVVAGACVEMGLRSALDPMRHTLLVERPGGLDVQTRGLLVRAAAEWSAELDVCSLVGDVLHRGLPEGRRAALPARLALIRPDHYVLARSGGRGARALLGRLGSVLGAPAIGPS